MPVVVLGEYRFGIKAARDRKTREKWLDAVEAAMTVLGTDSATARSYADVREELRQARTPIPENDIWIAALARQHGLPVLSRDVHFDRVSSIRRIGW